MFPWPLPKQLLSERDIEQIVGTLAGEITDRYRDCPRPLLVIGVLKGAFLFLADLTRRIAIPQEIDFIAVSSYGDAAVSSGQVRLSMDVSTDIHGRDVLLVEDIVDTGVTIEAVRRLLAQKEPSSLAVCALLSKPERRQVATDIDFIGQEIADVFVVGYGMDYAGDFRSLPYIGQIDPQHVRNEEQ
ncbi:MAG: hypoxanthine phosphoribosyltransferase [Desulfobulbaceae bacterium]|jgi:hypoxanthine phosphoribosyltransferase|nr:hypoxanthine phosphoribosyltransferase [Desulfobulbaceae bacterium]